MTGDRSGGSGEPDRRTVFVSLVSRPENLDDIVLRREMVRWFAADHDVVALSSIAPRATAELFSLPSGTVVHGSVRRWNAHLLRAVARRSAAVVYAPGPQALDLTARSLARSAASSALALGLPLARTPIVKLGRALRGPSTLLLRCERLAVGRGAVYMVRDQVSADALGAGATVVPDLAFGMAPPPTTVERDQVAFSPRIGRGLSPDARGAAVADCVRAGLEPVLVTQTQFDQPAHSHLAQGLGIRHVGWTSESAEEQLGRVTGAYARSVVVVSDRLHALVFGAVAGARPMVIVPDVGAKAASALDAAGIPWWSTATSSVADVLALTPGTAVDEAVAVAATRLEGARRLVLDHIAR